MAKCTKGVVFKKGEKGKCKMDGVGGPGEERKDEIFDEEI